MINNPVLPPQPLEPTPYQLMVQATTKKMGQLQTNRDNFNSVYYATRITAYNDLSNSFGSNFYLAIVLNKGTTQYGKNVQSNIYASNRGYATEYQGKNLGGNFVVNGDPGSSAYLQYKLKKMNNLNLIT